jgi:hypothetical protein
MAVPGVLILLMHFCILSLPKQRPMTIFRHFLVFYIRQDETAEENMAENKSAL